MPSARALATMKRGGVYHPPGSIFRDMTDAEIERLGAHVDRVPDDASGLPEASSEPPPATTAPGAEAAAPEPVTATEEAGGEEATRVEQVRDAIDLIDASDFTAAGRPKVQPLADVLGFKPSADEITTALALREEQGL